MYCCCHFLQRKLIFENNVTQTLIVHLKGNQTADASWHENVENVQIFLSMHIGSFFAKKSRTMKISLWHIWYFCHICRHCFLCHWHTAGLKMAALVVLFLRLSNVDFLTIRTRMWVKNCCVSVSVLFLSLSNWVLDACLFPFKNGLDPQGNAWRVRILTEMHNYGVLGQG